MINKLKFKFAETFDIEEGDADEITIVEVVQALGALAVSAAIVFSPLFLS